MANKDMVKGAEPCGRMYELQVYKAESTIYPGDFVNKTASGTVEPAAAGEALLGVAMHYATAGAEVLVADHPDQLFVIQADGADIDEQSDIGKGYAITVGAANSTYKRSAMELDSSTGETVDDQSQLRLVRLARDVDNAFGANVKCVVRINNHQNNQPVDEAEA